MVAAASVDLTETRTRICPHLSVDHVSHPGVGLWFRLIRPPLRYYGAAMTALMRRNYSALAHTLDSIPLVERGWCSGSCAYGGCDVGCTFHCDYCGRASGERHRHDCSRGIPLRDLRDAAHKGRS